MLSMITFVNLVSVHSFIFIIDLLLNVSMNMERALMHINSVKS